MSQPSYWIYVPTKGVPIVFAVLFFTSGIMHLWQNNLKYKSSWRINFLLPWAAAIFVAGFGLREYGAYHPFDEGDSNKNLAIFVASTVLLFVAPPVYSGALYFIFGRTLYYIPYLSPLHPGRVWTTFVALDGVIEAIAGNGASRAANSHNTASQIKAGFDLVKVSLIMQLALFVAFVALVAVFHRRCIAASVFTYRLKVIIYTMYASSCLILIRNCFRTATFFLGPLQPANKDEVFFWVFEALPMLANTFLLNIYPPAKYMPADSKIYLATDGKTELIGPGVIDKRHFLLTLIDPFDIGGLVRKKDSKNRFWENDGIGGPKKGETTVQA